jgi:hypothetical protein
MIPFVKTKREGDHNVVPARSPPCTRMTWSTRCEMLPSRVAVGEHLDLITRIRPYSFSRRTSTQGFHAAPPGTRTG